MFSKSDDLSSDDVDFLNESNNLLLEDSDNLSFDWAQRFWLLVNWFFNWSLRSDDFSDSSV